MEEHQRRARAPMTRDASYWTANETEHAACSPVPAACADAAQSHGWARTSPRHARVTIVVTATTARPALEPFKDLKLMGSRMRMCQAHLPYLSHPPLRPARRTPRT